MDKETFFEMLSVLDSRMHQNKAEYDSIIREAANIDHSFCECGYVQEWLEMRTRQTRDELFDFLDKLKSAEQS